MKILPSPFEKTGATQNTRISNPRPDNSNPPQNTLILETQPGAENSGSAASTGFPVFKPSPFEQSVTPTSSLSQITDRIIAKNPQIGVNSINSLAAPSFLSGKQKRKEYVSVKRKKPEIPRVANKKLQVNLSFDISELRKKACCALNCTYFFDKTGVLDVRTLYWGTLENPTKCHEQNSWVSKQLVKWSTFTANKPVKFQYLYKSRPICATAFQHLLPIGKNRMIKLREDIKQLGKFFSRMLASNNGWRCIYF